MDYLSETAKALGVDRSTVCRAISRSQCMSPNTQKKIFEYINEHYPDKLVNRDADKLGKKAEKFSITVVMPYKPNYFWDIAADGMRDANRNEALGEIDIKYIFYSGSLSETELLDILDGVNLDITDAIALVPVNTKKVSEKIKAISEKIPVALFNECCPDSGSFINVVSDGYREGEEAARMLVQNVASGSCVLAMETVCYESYVVDKRLEGFIDTMVKISEESGRDIVVDTCSIFPNDIGTEERRKYFSNTTMPSIMAREISKKIEFHLQKGRKIGGIYIPTGNLHPLLMALKKLKEKDILVYGHESDPKSLDFFMSGVRGGYVRQDIYMQGYITLSSLNAKLRGDKDIYPEIYYTGFESCQYK